MQELIGEQVALVGGRYVWRGRLAQIDGPFLKLEKAYQITDHSEDEIREELYWGTGWVPPGAWEFLASAKELAWCP